MNLFKPKEQLPKQQPPKQRLLKYEPPKIVTRTDDELLQMMGPAQAGSTGGDDSLWPTPIPPWP